MRTHPLEATKARLADFRAIFSIPGFATYQAGNLTMTTGFWMQRVAVGWVTWELTGSEFWLGMVAFAELFPSIFTAIYGGIIVDRYPTPWIMLWGQIFSGSISLMLAVLYFLSLLNPIAIVVLMCLLGAVSGALLPARLAMASYLAPKELLPQALAVNSTGFNLSRFIGPAIAAAIMAVSSASLVFAISTIAFFCLAFSLYQIRNLPAQNPRKIIGDPVSTLQVIKDLSLMPTILAIILLQIFQGLFLRPASELFPAYADVAFNMGATGLGMLNAALGVGAVIGALTMSKSREPKSAIRQIVLMAGLFALSLLAFSATNIFWLALVILVFHGAFMSAKNIAALAYVQIETPPDRLGRILSIYTIVFRVTPAIGALIFGLSADNIGLMPTGITFSICGLIAATIVGGWLLKQTLLDQKH